MQLPNALQLLIGKTYLYNSRQYTVYCWKFIDDQVVIGTDSEILVLPEAKAKAVIMHEFLPVESQDNKLQKIVPHAVTVMDVLMENLTKLQGEHSKETIERARATCQVANSMTSVMNALGKGKRD